MKDLIKKLNKAFENRIRLGVMSALMVNESLDFNALKEILGATDGNLATHLKTLEDAGYIGVHKRFINRKPNTNYSVTKLGQSAFEDHLHTLESILNNKSLHRG